MTSISLIWDIAVLLLALIMIVISAKRGLIKSLVHSAKLIFAFIFASTFGNVLGAFFKDQFVYNAVYDFAHGKVSEVYQNATGNVTPEQIMEQLPPFAQTEEVRAALEGVSGEGSNLIDTLSANVANPVSDIISNALGYVCVFFLSLIVLWIAAVLITKIADRIPFIGAINHILGGVWGALTATVVLLLIASVFKLFFADTDLYTQSVILKFLGDNATAEIIKVFGLEAVFFG